MRSSQNGCLGIIVFAVIVAACIASGRKWWIVGLSVVGSYLVAAVAVWAVYAWREARIAAPPPPRPAHLGVQLYEPDRALGAPYPSDPTDTRVF